MHQGSLKSDVRRSLTKSPQLHSQDDNETVQSRTIGKSKSTAAVEFISRRSHRRQDPAPSKGKEEEKAMAYRNSNDFQLLQVSREAHKLAEMIDSWSKTTNIDSRSQFFAEDLLRGALDLQESLDMLKKLQDASKKMSGINNKQKYEFTGKKDEVISARELGSKRFAVSNYQNRLQEPRLSADDFSRNCVEELKQVIKESLHKQNVLTSSSDDEKSSSSRSMRYGTSNRFENKHLEQNAVTVKSICSTDQPKKARSSNLIAKLMGLEDVPSEIVQSIRKEEKDCVNSPRPRFDIEMPRARKMQFLVQNNDQKQNGLDELIETIHFKGLLKRSQVEKKGLEQPLFGTTELKQFGRNLHKVDQLPPIVIMKPLHLRYQKSKVHKEHALDKTLTLKARAVKLVQENNSSDHKNMLGKTLEQKEVKHIAKDITESLPDYETPCSPYHTRQRKKAIMAHKKNTEEQKPSTLNMNKQEEKGVKATRMTISHPKTSTVQAKPNKELPIARTNASTYITVPQNQDLKSSLVPIPKAPTDSAKDKNKAGVKQIRKSAIIEPVTDSKKCNENSKVIKSCNMMNDVPKEAGTFHGDDIFQQAEKETKTCNPDNMSKDHKIFCEAITRSNQDGRSYRLIEEFIQLPACQKVDGAAAGIEDDLKNIFLSSQSFLVCAKKIFGVDAIEPMYHQKESTDKLRKCDSKLFLDVSKEIMARKYHQQKHKCHPLLQAQSCCKITYFSIDKLVEEISNGIRKLTSYSKLDSVDTSEDISLYIRLERELMCKDTAINSVWDIGWDNWICLEDADQVVEEVGKQILSRLIEEAALELI